MTAAAYAELDKYIRLLEKKSEPSFNDRAFTRYVSYINVVLSHFGKERVYLVGSTTEHLKIRWSKDGGDVDFLMLSGMLEVPVENIEFRPDTPCIIWVKVDRDSVDKNISLIGNKYLPCDVLRSVGPELFTILRGIYLLFANNTSYTPRSRHITTHILTSKVGLAVSQYCDFRIDGRTFSYDRTIPKKPSTEADTAFRNYMVKRKCESRYHREDVQIMRQALEFISFTKIPGSTGSRQGYWEHFAYLCGPALERMDSFIDQTIPKTISKFEQDGIDGEDFENTEGEFVNDFDSLPEKQLVFSEHFKDNQVCGGENHRNIRATYSERTCKDFVPAVRIVGKLKCMEEWKNSVHNWLSPGEVETIFNMDVFFVARFAPVNPSRKDFCLSFTLAENKLCECLSPVQRHVMLVLKTYLKGIISEKHKEQGRELKLTTFHMKTAMYHVCDTADPGIWLKENTLYCIILVVEYLQKSLFDKQLLHYFIPSNLFAAFESEDFSILLGCVADILSDPIGSIKQFFDLDDGVPNEIWLTEEEVRELERLTADGGVRAEIDALEEAILDILRGLSDAPRDFHGYSLLRPAISALLEIYFKDEVDVRLRKASRRLNLRPESTKALIQFVPFLSQAIGEMLTIPDTGSVIGDVARVFEPFGSEEEKQRTFESLKYSFVTHFCRDDD